MTNLLDSQKSATFSLGDALRTHRIEQQVSLRDLADRCRIGIEELEQLEYDRADLTTAQLTEAVDAYRVPRRAFPAGHTGVLVDLVGGSVVVDVRDTQAIETPIERFFLSYLELVVGQDAAMSTVVPITSLDLTVLRSVLTSRRADVEARLAQLLGARDEAEASGDPTATIRLSRVLSITVAVVGAATTALLVFGPFRQSASVLPEPAPTAIVASREAVSPPTDIGEARAVARDASGAEVDVAPGSAQVVAGESGGGGSVVIIDPLVLERGPNDEVDPSTQRRDETP